MSPRPIRQSTFLVAAALSAAAASLFAQSAPPSPAGTPTGAPAGAPTAQGAQTAQGGQGAPGAAGGQGVGRGAATEPDFSQKPPIVALSPADEAKRLWLPPGFKMTPVLTDPDIQEPAQIAFDGNGRLFVLEIRGYMQDADATGELAPVGRVSVHEDRDSNGLYETHKVFVDNMVFPRFVMPIGRNAILTKESNADEVWKLTDTNGDGTADKKELFATGLGRLLNVEHQESGFFWALDNWIYSTINPVRIRWTPNGVLREPTGSNGGQWGATQDNYGKVWFQAGASGMPGYFQLPIVYGNFNYPEQFEPDLNITWGAPVLIADMQGGMGAVRMPDGSLSRATGAAGNDVFRGDRLPKDMVGDYFYGEAVARIVRRLHPVKTDGMTQLKNVYPLSEFLRSTDPLFRPVDVTTAPDGTMYITDMYRGIVQESQWSGPGTYLRRRIEQYALDKIVKRGRIWRLSHDSMPRRAVQPRMLDETAAQLVAHLTDPNGWWRDTAQQLLVLKQDKSVVPALKTLATTSPNGLGRIHALWTLEGLSAADAVTLRALMKDADPQIRVQAIRVSESLYKSGDRSFAADYRNLTRDANVDVVMQAMMTLNTLKVADANATIKAAQGANNARGVQIVATTILNRDTSGVPNVANILEGIVPYTSDEQGVIEKGKQIYGEVCFACHGEDGRGEPLPGGAPGATRAPALAASPRVVGHQDYVVKTLLHGLTGSLNGVTYQEVMIPMGQNNDEWVAAIGSYIRNAFGNRAALITPAQVARVRASSAERKTSWSTTEIAASLPKQLVVDSGWKLTASHNSPTASNALSIQPWSTGEAQKPGMWLELQLPQPATIAELSFESAAVAPENVLSVPGAPTRTAIPAGAGRGRGGAAGAPAAPAAAPPPPPPPAGFPRGYQIQTSMDGVAWTEVARGQGTGVVTDVAFAPVRARFVRITQTATADGLPPWSVQRLKIFEPGVTAR